MPSGITRVGGGQTTSQSQLPAGNGGPHHLETGRFQRCCEVPAACVNQGWRAAGHTTRGSFQDGGNLIERDGLWWGRTNEHAGTLAPPAEQSKNATAVCGGGGDSLSFSLPSESEGFLFREKETKSFWCGCRGRLNDTLLPEAMTETNVGYFPVAIPVGTTGIRALV